jgi:hypothetical protein
MRIHKYLDRINLSFTYTSSIYSKYTNIISVKCIHEIVANRLSLIYLTSVAWEVLQRHLQRE